MSKASVDAGRGFIEAFNGADWNRLEALLTPDSLYDEVGTGRRAQGGNEIVYIQEGSVTLEVEGKPPAAAQKIIEGKLEKYYSVACLLDQPFVKVQEKSVKDILTETIAKTGENIQVRRFVRFELGS